ncbi:hypothetical protein [Croceicoccus hydrothermalis]|uniref:hypothetical protein n=1 Tax=Croceicoccus hydrothermalis TaxID=2867964 RepID=UPI001EFB3ADE|nr:hypothetical protein [Croceicoccus hydrothermalis]
MTATHDEAQIDRRARPGLWIGLYFASIAAVAGLRLSDAIHEPVGFILLACCFTLLIPMARARNRTNICMSPAVRRYNTRLVATSLAYITGLGVAVWIHNRLELSPLALFFVALLPVIPTLAIIFIMGRYIVEEQDEYLRHRAVQASLVGLGAVLALGSFWGFLETFSVVPHVPGWMSVPVFAVGMSAAQCWMTLRNRADDKA